jgi:hypothetical protein
MRILIIAHILLYKELNQNGILSCLCKNLNATFETTCSLNFASIELNQFDRLILWTHPDDQTNYDYLTSKFGNDEKFFHLEFKKRITYGNLSFTDNRPWVSSSTFKENPDFHEPSKYFKSLQFQMRELLKRI